MHFAMLEIRRLCLADSHPLVRDVKVTTDSMFRNVNFFRARELRALEELGGGASKN